MPATIFRRLLEERHPVSHARGAFACDVPAQAEVWRELAEGGWLEMGSEAFLSDHWDIMPALGEAVGRSLLTLPLGFPALVLLPLAELAPELVSAGVILAPVAHAASGHIDTVPAPASFFDFQGQAAHHYRLTALNQSGRRWTLARYRDDALMRVDAVDACVRLGTLMSPEPEASMAFSVAPEPMARLLHNHLAFMLAELTGAGDAALELAVAYARERVQFGHAIGEYQAVKHALANAWVALENGRYAVRHLLEASRSGAFGEAASTVLLAQRVASGAGKQATALAIQVHGGIGFAWEHDAHLFYKRALRLAVRSAAISRLIGDGEHSGGDVPGKAG